MRKFVKKVQMKDVPRKRLSKLKTVTVKDAAAISREKVILYTDCGKINIANDLTDQFKARGIKNTMKRRCEVVERLKYRKVELNMSKHRLENLARFVY